MASIASTVNRSGYSSFSNNVANGFSTLKNVGKDAINKTVVVVQVAFRTFAELPSDTGRHASVGRKFQKYLIPFAEIAAKRFSCFKAVKILGHLKESIGNVADIMELFRVVVPINYFLNKKYKKDPGVKVAAEVACAVADFSGAALFLNEVNVINLGKISEKIGKTRFFSPLAKIPLGPLAFGACFVAHGLFAINAYKNLQKANSKDVPLKRLELASCVSDVALDTLLLAGVVSIPTLAVVSGVSVALTVATVIKKMK
jgi:hypothetical protein